MDTPLDRFYAALGRGDIAAARACYTPDARVWHGFDGIAHDLDASTEQWARLIRHGRDITVADVWRRPVDDGLVQRHLFAMTDATGTRKVWAVCVIVRLEGDRIARLDEYIDRAGDLADGAGGPHVTPGTA